MNPRSRAVSRRASTPVIATVIAVVLGLGVFLFVRSRDSEPAAPAETAPKIEKVVIIIKENRTFDSLFGTFPGANGATTGQISTGETVPLTKGEDVYPHDIAHDFVSAIEAMNGGEMNSFDTVPGGPDLLPYTQYTKDQLPAYWRYAKHYVLGDRMFSSTYGPTPPEHLYLIAGQGKRIVTHAEIGEIVNSEYCDEPRAKFHVLPKDPRILRWEINSQIEKLRSLFRPIPACVKMRTIFDELDDKGISWKYYTRAHQYQNIARAVYNIRRSDQWDNVTNPKQFMKDAKAGNLPQVSYLIPPSVFNEHPTERGRSFCVGENWTVKRVNSIMEGPEWDNVAIFIVWDDYGGLYDHVPPPRIDDMGLGPRVPFLVISPWSKDHHISHWRYEFSSLLAFQERLFGLDPLTVRDRDARDIFDEFNFDKPEPNPPLVLEPRPEIKQIPARCDL